ncbi:dihydroxyacetone kinase subunit L [Ligilactobacillus ruminis]|mgnify:FL=1|uniref:phosphoenolpyruvate--glycerone phosphotransferase n=1 Tax=Ligilactobacillus ruminis TaxID=1623 RepID=A0A3E4MAN4_9LACO|nr:dihydroxyacetone kinase subunit DhaL [Ligilactobacillus ruminis]MBD9205524.1 dihydroxyacetone kinase subunit L [Ligilactobacillus ruminis]MSB43179.1 dihydroxyacetone kinase subunit L [Ligilactobacillus ruminis]MSB53580.1 dihydroxyacetone kinase subunit L [Ligilactobacillus ruminis]MSB55549.1 dihydroxyacetone kinase subunit L [Ligilactobacillus ruminis]MSB80590.1 dihydroxyacetone kinase subunit L [Ligilactobacillus ruminis]
MELTKELLAEWISRFYEKIQNNKGYLSDLDAAIGDGDHGNNMARGMQAVTESLEKNETADTTQSLKLIAMALISKVGGASGPLYGTAFLEMAKASNDTKDLGELLQKALSGIEKRGGAQPNDKTMVDVWNKVVSKADDSSLTNADIEAAVESTKDMVAKKGRASYLGERSVGHLDPGAVSSGYLFEALLEAEGSL